MINPIISRTSTTSFLQVYIDIIATTRTDDQPHPVRFPGQLAGRDLVTRALLTLPSVHPNFDHLTYDRSHFRSPYLIATPPPVVSPPTTTRLAFGNSGKHPPNFRPVFLLSKPTQQHLGQPDPSTSTRRSETFPSGS